MNTIIFSIIRDKFRISRMETRDDVPSKDMCLLDHIDKIVRISRKYGIEKCLRNGKGHIAHVAAKLGISPVAAVIFSHFLDESDDTRIQLSAIARSLQCSIVRILKYMIDCEELEKKGLVRCSRGGNGISYRIPREVKDSLRKNGEYIPDKYDNLSVFRLFKIIERIFREREDKELSYDRMKLELLDLINLNMQLEFCKKITGYNLDEDALVLLMCFCHLFGNNSDDFIISRDLEFLYGDGCDITVSEVEIALSSGIHPAMEAKLIEYTNSNGFADTDSWKLSEKAKKEMMADFRNKGNRNYKKNMILFSSIKPKKMFYNSRETGEIQQLVSLLLDENYRKIQDRLDGKGMRKGFACLFSGGPGTGKTETAYQIARETKRNIMKVDISDTKSMWYGESEKKIKEIFDTYRTAAEESEIAPILLFNEADAIIGMRKEFSAASRSLDQTENTIQNIILEEMENFSGILIATTNLTQNLDKAFERRFLYKINFDKPGMESRLAIWNYLLPDLPEESAGELSSRYELSGGQIENIARKVEVDAILNGSSLSMDTLLQYCKTEIVNGYSTCKKIGFRID